ncbi:MAG: type II secretion system F family protein, partial [Candidatus Hydrogenedentes bacterium]|nr:type II secretion system F family protein [Candidatus Hydrogenedentota bacterium]
MATADRTGGERRTVKRVTRKKTTIQTAAAEPAEEEVVVRVAEEAVSPGRASVRGMVRHSDVTSFLRQLIMLLEAGTPILRSLKTLSSRGQRASARALIADVAAYVEAGNPLWQAFDRHPRYFDSVFVNLIRASEASGTLVTVLRRTVDYREKRELLTKRVRGAMIYPILLVVACFGVMVLLITVVIPQFKDLFEKAGIADQVPWYTNVLLNTSDSFLKWCWVPVVALFLLIFIYKFWYVRGPLRRLRADRVKLRIPIMGKILHKSALVELTRTMSLLLRSGLS